MQIKDEKSWRAARNYLSKKGVPESNEEYKTLAQAVINAYLKNRWKPFDKDNCKLDSGEYRLCRTNESRNGMEMLSYSGDGYWMDYECIQFDNVTHYLDPPDILPEPEGEV